MNQSMSETSRSSRLSEVLNSNYEDLSADWGAVSIPRGPLDLKSSGCFPEGPEYLNIAQNLFPLGESLDNPDYQAGFLPQASSTSLNGAVFLPTAENLEYLGLGAGKFAPVR